MTDLSTPQPVGDLAPAAPARLRFVTAAALFDGHDAAINIVRRVLQTSGAEVIHLGHNRCVDEVANAALDEDADGVAISSYQGGHIEYFRYLIDCLRARLACARSLYYSARKRLRRCRDAYRARSARCGNTGAGARRDGHGRCRQIVADR